MLAATDKYMTLLGNLPLWQKLALVVAAMGVPAVAGYQLGAGMQPTSARAATTRNTDVAPETDNTNEMPAPRAKRRSPGRTQRRATGSAQVAAAVAVTEDSEWQEF